MKNRKKEKELWHHLWGITAYLMGAIENKNINAIEAYIKLLSKNVKLLKKEINNENSTKN